jgi:hypothetical protein
MKIISFCRKILLTKAAERYIKEAMKLKDYLLMIKVPPYKWAQEHSFSQGAIYSWLRGIIPDLRTILKIQRITKGDVRPDDWI